MVSVYKLVGEIEDILKFLLVASDVVIFYLKGDICFNSLERQISS